MVFHKSFAKQVPGTRYPEWIEISLSDAEEARVESVAREQHIDLMKECLADALQVLKDKELKDYQTNVVQMAVAFFEKRASHTVWHKETEARKKFDKEN